MSHNYNRGGQFNYRINGFQNNYQNNNYQNRPRYKNSGVSYSIINSDRSNFTGFPIVNAWYKSKQGLTKISIKPYHKTDQVVTSQTGNEYLKMIAEIQHPTGHTEIIPVLYNEKTKKCVIKQKGLLITPNGGGYTRSGKFVKGSVVQLK